MSQAVLAVDIGGSKLLAGWVDRAGHVLAYLRRPWPELTERAVVGTVLDTCRELLAKQETGPVAIGVNIPGLADAERGIWVEASFSGIADVPIAKIMTEALGLPVYLDNDVNNCALAESKFGCCRGVDDFVWITVSNGCGGALYLNGSLYKGAHGYAGEVGHIRVEYDGGFLCGCGHCGCLEAQASGRGVARTYERLSGQEASAEKIAMLARGGDAAAAEAYRITGTYLGRACAAVINTLNPRQVVIGGGVSNSFDLLEETLRKTVRESVYPQSNRTVPIVRTGLGDLAGLVGAASCAMR